MDTHSWKRLYILGRTARILEANVIQDDSDITELKYETYQKSLLNKLPCAAKFNI